MFLGFNLRLTSFSIIVTPAQVLSFLRGAAETQLSLLRWGALAGRPPWHLCRKMHPLPVAPNLLLQEQPVQPVEHKVVSVLSFTLRHGMMVRGIERIMQRE